VEISVDHKKVKGKDSFWNWEKGIKEDKNFLGRFLPQISTFFSVSREENRGECGAVIFFFFPISKV